jgi:thiamine pyrophosphate-dependent acetolactate synthase large subunit-like protein
MGTALSAGLGVRLASGLPTVVVIGDWGFFMGSSELHTAASLGIGGFAIVIWSNAGGALVRTGVRAQRFEVPAQTHSWPPPQFDLIAKGCGMRALTVRTAQGLRRAATVALRSPFPVLIDAQIDPDATPPGAADRYIHLDTSMQTT